VRPAKELVDDEYGAAAVDGAAAPVGLHVVGHGSGGPAGGQRVPVLVMAREVPAGQVLGDQDVRVAELGLGPGVATLGVGDRGRVVGQVASVPLAAGQVLP